MVKQPYRPTCSQDSVPKIRGHCENGPRPCPWILCKYHLYLDVAIESRSNGDHFGKTLTEIPETCALDLANGNGMEWEEIGEVLGTTGQTAANIGKLALNSLKDKL